MKVPPKTARTLAVIQAITAIAAVVGLILALTNITDQTNQDRNQTNQNKQLIDDIRQERINSIFGNCNDQNLRNANTIASLKSEITPKSIEKNTATLIDLFHSIGISISPSQKKALVALETASSATSIVSTEKLIDALAPHHNCKLLVKQDTTAKLSK